MSIPEIQAIKDRKYKKPSGIQLRGFLKEYQKLTDKQRAMFELLMGDPGLISRPNQLARAAGYQISHNAKASQLIKNLEGKLGKSLVEIFGITEYDMMEVLVECLRAEKSTTQIIKKYKDGKPVSDSVITTTVPDLHLRLKTAQVLLKLGGYEMPAKLKIDHNVVHSLEGESIEMLNRRKEQQEKALLDIKCEVVDERAD